MLAKYFEFSKHRVDAGLANVLIKDEGEKERVKEIERVDSRSRGERILQVKAFGVANKGGRNLVVWK